MVTARPHYLLFCDITAKNNWANSTARTESCSGRWRFTLEALDGNSKLEASDDEHATNDERLALISVVRGLEALDQPSKVTLVTTSRYVSRGLRYGLNAWREADYTWERFGVHMPIRNADLWQRVGAALRFHGVDCRLIQAHPFAYVAAKATGENVAAERRLRDKHPAKTPEHRAVQQAKLTDRSAAVCRRPPASLESALPWFQSWWKLAAFWIRWWRHRLQGHPALNGV